MKESSSFQVPKYGSSSLST